MASFKTAIFLTGLACLSLLACDSGLGTQALVNDTTSTSKLELSTPPFISQTRVIDPADVFLEAIVNGTAIDMARQGDEWVGTVLVPVGEVASIELIWTQQSNDDAEPLVIGVYSSNIGPVTAPINLPLTTDDYSTADYDFDGDGISNLAEYTSGSDPRNYQDPIDPLTNVDVFIPRIKPKNAPAIDGEYDDIWNDAVFVDRDGTTLAIDKLLTGTDSNRADGATEFNWAALHDTEYLYLFVFGEYVDSATLVADSEEMWHDDSLELYLDGDNSKGTSYDGDNDYLLFLPHLKLKEALEANNSFDEDSRKHAGSNADESEPWPEAVEFVNCLCPTDRHTWEIRISLEQMDIAIETPFGIELQYSDDHDGEKRDAKWGWTRVTDEDLDDTWHNPSLMGTALLE